MQIEDEGETEFNQVMWASTKAVVLGDKVHIRGVDHGLRYFLAFPRAPKRNFRGARPHVSASIAALLLFLPAFAWGATYYLDEAGTDDVTGGKSTSEPWRTWAFAMAHSTCGDTLMVMDGTYTAAHGSLLVTKSCTENAPYTIRAQNERKAFINGDGSFVPLHVSSSSYVKVIGLRVRSADKDFKISADLGVCNAYNSNHITFSRMLCTHANRYLNAGHVVQFYNTHDSLIEENEVHYFHRHAFYVGGNSSRNTLRRNYCNSQGVTSIDGDQNEFNYAGMPAADCFLVYPGNNNIFENNISDGTNIKCFAVEALGSAVGNKFFGNICNGSQFGVAMDARGASASYMPRDTLFENQVVVRATEIAIRVDGNKNFRCSHCTVIDTKIGFDIDRLTAQPGDGIYSAFVNDSLVAGYTDVGFRVTPAVQTWTATHINTFGSGTVAYSPLSGTQYAPLATPQAIDPALGACKLWVPASSPMKKAGTNGSDIGATVLYRYEGGVLTNKPLWDLTTGRFPSGAAVSGVTDIPGKSVGDIHIRLNVNRNGCPFPVGYGMPDKTKPETPTALSAR